MNQNFGLPYPIYSNYQGMPNMMNTMPSPMILNNDCSNGNNDLEKRIDNLEKRVLTLENYINNSMNNYNSSNYQML